MDTSFDLSEKTIAPNPFLQFDTWYKEHLSLVHDVPEAMYLGTASPDGRVSLRTVLLKDYDNLGFTFFTNYKSNKSNQINSNNSVALLFYWPEKRRQVRIEGVAEKVSREISEEYFNTRPRDSQLGAWVSDQSSEIESREYLKNRFTFYNNMFAGSAVPCPDLWGGYRVIPDLFEFWVSRDYRLHDRIEYLKEGNEWIIRRLAP